MNELQEVYEQIDQKFKEVFKIIRMKKNSPNESVQIYTNKVLIELCALDMQLSLAHNLLQEEEKS